MSNSNLLGGEKPPQVPSGHGTADLGPGDTSDSGSDVSGTLPAHRSLGLERGPITLSRNKEGAQGVGPDLGDTNLDSDSDAEGTGERGSAGRDDAVEAADIEPDDITSSPPGLIDGDDPQGIGVTRTSADREDLE